MLAWPAWGIMPGCVAKYQGKTSMICSWQVRVTLQRIVARTTQIRVPPFYRHKNADRLLLQNEVRRSVNCFIKDKV